MREKANLKKLFETRDICFAVPSYQRAYSWEVSSDNEQVKQFFQDVQEQIAFTKLDEKGNIQRKPYFFGHFLFERVAGDAHTYFIIDGQQRLTTFIIFMSAFTAEIKVRQNTGERIFDMNGLEITEGALSSLYLKKEMFKTVSYDESFFNEVVYAHNVKGTTCTASAKRIKAAYVYFEKKLKKMSSETLVKIKDCLENTIITIFFVQDKIQATQIFAFQNDRGKELTALEKTKAYLMHKVYSLSENVQSAEAIISRIENIFSDIYKVSEEIPYDEDTVLHYYCTAYLSLHDTTMNRIKEWGQKLSAAEGTEKIEKFCLDLKEAFLTMKKIAGMFQVNSFVIDCVLLRPSSSIPLFLKLYRLNSDNENAIESVAKKVENILFKLTFTVAEYRTDLLPKIALDYDGDIDELESQLESIQYNGFQWWWEFSKNCRLYFEQQTWHYRSEIKYVLWKYENFKRAERGLRLVSPADFINKYEKKRLENTIDHITPQQPNFTEYTEQFKEQYLNCIGNLALITWGNNSQKSNNSPVLEVEKYHSDYLSNQEIRVAILEAKRWGKKEIAERRKKIVDFVIDKWALADDSK